MSQTYIITELIGIKDKNIKLFDKLTYVCKKSVRYKVLYGRLTYTPTVCPLCRILVSRNIIQPMYTTNPQTASQRLTI